MTDDPRRLETRIVHAARDRRLTAGGVNPVVQRASTVLVESADQLYAPGAWTYGRHGGATHEALVQAMCELEDARHCILTPSGLLACTMPFFGLGEAGGHVLVADTVYGPTRRFCDRALRRWGCETQYFDPRIGGAIAGLIRPETRLIFLESPGSLTFEISDTPAIVAAARKANVPTVMDNTWSGGVCCKPLALGADVTVQASTKYVSGGADVLSGAILTNRDDLFVRIKDGVADLGLNVSADDAWLVLRGLRTLPVRMTRHSESALEIAHWLADRPEVAEVLHPALPAHPDHAIWKRDFSGSSGLFAIVLKPCSKRQVNAFLDALHFFGLGFSYGGFESLAIHCNPQLRRTAMSAAFAGPLIRFSIGLENTADLKADLEAGFAVLSKTPA